MNNEVCPFCGAQREATIFAVIWKCGSSTLLGSQGADAPGLRQSTICRRLCEQQDKIGELRGTIAADDERLRKAAERAGIEHCGCDAAEWMADEIERLTTALKAIVRHQDAIGGGLAELSTTRRIAVGTLNREQAAERRKG